MTWVGSSFSKSKWKYKLCELVFIFNVWFYLRKYRTNEEQLNLLQINESTMQQNMLWNILYLHVSTERPFMNCGMKHTFVQIFHQQSNKHTKTHLYIFIYSVYVLIGLHWSRHFLKQWNDSHQNKIIHVLFSGVYL